MGLVTQPSSASVHRPATAAGAKAFVVTPFARLARTHAGSTMADAMVTAAFAGAVFFSLPADDARGPVLRYLVITMLPFAVLSPLVGPLIDRMKGGHRLVLIGSIAVRVVLCWFLIGQIGDAGPAFFLLALCLLVAQKAYQVARSALVPTVVESDAALVEANSKLSLISGLAGFVGVLPAALLMKVFGPEWALGLAMLTYATAAVIGSRIERARVAETKADETERHELRGVTIVLAGSAMGLLRACVGFLTLLIAFDFRGGDRRPWEFGVVAAASVVSQLLGAAAAPRIREHTSEENLLTGVLALVVVGGVLALFSGDVVGAALLGSCVGFAAGGGKLAFDSILQRDAPDANRGRSFAKFETRFQVTWVLGALLAVAAELHATAGFFVILLLALVALTSYVIGRLALAHRTGSRQTAATAAAVEIEERFAEVSTEVKGRLASAPGKAFRRMRGTQGGAPADGLGGPEAAAAAEAGLHHAGEPVADPATARIDEQLAAGSPLAWQPPPDDEPTYPWEPPVEPHDGPGSFLADVDASVENPFPWTPDDPTMVGRIDPEAATRRATQDVARPGSPAQVRRRRRARRAR
jgi:hypothetical protein